LVKYFHDIKKSLIWLGTSNEEIRASMDRSEGLSLAGH